MKFRSGEENYELILMLKNEVDEFDLARSCSGRTGKS